MKVINQWGYEVDFDAAVQLMDENIREQIHQTYAPCSEQEFFEHYCCVHFYEYDEVFELDKPNPVY